MVKALYRQYRPKELDEVVGQEHITTTLKNALKSGKISHAYLFTGPRGVGKTSIARILAHEVNDFIYDESSTQLDIIEIDAASNRRIDEIRDLRDKVNLSPTTGKYKVYIIDEVHMLTKEAFNALLKTLEEPPAHVIFILATTEAHKLPETIVSRTQRFSFKPIDSKPLVAHLKNISKRESIDIDDEALQLIAKHGGGSFRDSISLLDQVSSMGSVINLADVQQMLGLAPETAIDNLVDHLGNGSPHDIVKDLTSLEEQGIQPSSIAKQIGENLRTRLISGQLVIESDSTINLLSQLIGVPASPSPDKLLEVILLEVVLKKSDKINLQASTTQMSEPVNYTKTVSQPRSHKTVISSDSKASLKPQKGPQEALVYTHEDQLEANNKKLQSFKLESWQQILDDIKVHHNTLYGTLRMATPSYSNNELKLSFKFAFHQKRINETKTHQHIKDAFDRLNITPVNIVAVVDPAIEPPIAAPEPTVDIAAISNIFGDAEVLES